MPLPTWTEEQVAASITPAAVVPATASPAVEELAVATDPRFGLRCHWLTRPLVADGRAIRIVQHMLCSIPGDRTIDDWFEGLADYPKGRNAIPSLTARSSLMWWLQPNPWWTSTGCVTDGYVKSAAHLADVVPFAKPKPPTPTAKSIRKKFDSDDPSTWYTPPTTHPIGPNGRPRCNSHNDPRLWLESKHPKRSNLIRTTCRACGIWIGDRPADGKDADQQTNEPF